MQIPDFVAMASATLLKALKLCAYHLTLLKIIAGMAGCIIS
jgi:hypothetical protein